MFSEKYMRIPGRHIPHPLKVVSRRSQSVSSTTGGRAKRPSRDYRKPASAAGHEPLPPSWKPKTATTHPPSWSGQARPTCPVSRIPDVVGTWVVAGGSGAGVGWRHGDRAGG